MQASTQAGSRPFANRSSQKVHFSTTPFVLVGNSGVISFIKGLGSIQLKLLEPYDVSTEPEVRWVNTTATERDWYSPVKTAAGR